MKGFSAEAVAIIALWKSAPIGSLVSVPPAPRFHVSLHWTGADREFFQVPLLRDDHRGANFSPAKPSICGISSNHTGLFYNLSALGWVSFDPRSF